MMKCPQCGTMNSDEAKNCGQCRINVYWASQHYSELVTTQNVNQPDLIDTPTFLVEASKRVDRGPTASWLRNIVKKFGLKDAGKKVSTLRE